MQKGTVLTIVTCLLVLVVILFVQTCNSAEEFEAAAQASETVETVQVASAKKDLPTAVNKGENAEKFKFETDLFRITFDTCGASISSLSLKNHANADGQFVDMIFKGENDRNAFLSYWEDDTENPVLDAFSYSVSGKKVTFRKTFRNSDNTEFTLVKTFEFKDGEYLFEVSVDFEGNAPKGEKWAYSLAFEPQVGPSFTTIKNNNYDYRRVYLGLEKKNGKIQRSLAKFSDNDFYTTKDLKWFSLTSKYFTVIALPLDSDVVYKYHAIQGSGDISLTDSLYISVPSSDAGTKKTFCYYCGPQLKKYLGSYYNGTDNAWGLRDLNLDDAMESGSALGWLENILKWCLNVLYKVVANYGVDIIILTIIIKLVLWPLNNKSMESTAKMGALSDQMKEIQAKYANNPQKQNEAMSALYRENGVSPLGGCLPLLIQFPILIAFYGLLNKHFELRGAMFIPGWIIDLSVPETVATLGFKIPLLGNEIHLLPFIYTASMIFSMKFTQASNKNAPQQQGMWFMTWGMPIMFFFVLYSAPSGLLLYWTVQNFLSILQQIYTNKRVASGKFKTKKTEEKKVPAAILKYQEKLKKLEEEQAQKEKKKDKK